MKKNILIVGTGTIGEPLIGLLADLKNKLQIDVYFNKRTPLADEVAKVESLINRGAKLVTSPVRKKKFEKMGHAVTCTYEEALKKADVVIDCTPAGNENKELYYLPSMKLDDKKRTFIAQGSEKGFGVPYAYGINDEVLNEKTNFIQVVSCNTHNIACIIRTLSPSTNDIISSDFTCIRRANDISQEGSFIASPYVGKHNDSQFGTHHARDVYDLFRTRNEFINIYSSALKVNSQYMHVVRFNMEVKGFLSKERVLQRLKENKFVSLTEKQLANKVFSFGRDHGYYGRIFNQTVVSEPSISVNLLNGSTRIAGFCFTPQDGNSLLSSIAAALYGLHGSAYADHLKTFDKFLFQNI